MDFSARFACFVHVMLLVGRHTSRKPAKLSATLCTSATVPLKAARVCNLLFCSLDP